MHTPYTVTDPARLRDEIASVRSRGWAVSPNETMIGLNALAAPIFDAFGKYAGALAMTDSVQFLGETPTNEQLQHLREAARKISANLGFRERAAPSVAALQTH